MEAVIPKLAAPVGVAQTNNTSDVMTVQSLLNRSALTGPGSKRLAVDGLWGPATQQAVQNFQSTAVHLSQPDGIVAPDGPTFRLLAAHASPPTVRHTKPPRAPSSLPPQQPAATTNPGTGGTAHTAGQLSLSEDDYVNAAHQLHCEAAAIKAIAQTETGTEGAFDSQGRPSILFERHYFHRLTHGRFDKSDPDISNPHAGGYGKFSEQYGKLDRAIKLDADAALQSASWGKFQIMGASYREAGFLSVQAFVDAEKRSVQDHLAALVSYINSNPTMLRALQQKDWAGFAYRYNGANYKENDYDTKMSQNYQRALRNA